MCLLTKVVIVTSSGLISKPVCAGDAQPTTCSDADVGQCGSDCVQVRRTGRERCLECNTECETCCSVENMPLLVDTPCKDTALRTRYCKVCPADLSACADLCGSYT